MGPPHDSGVRPAVQGHVTSAAASHPTGGGHLGAPGTSAACSDARPRLSVVIPAYNEADALPETLRAARASLEAEPLLAGVELIVVDDGSTDGTEGAASAGGADAVVRHDRNRGKGAALETGLRRASGDLLLLLDADLRGTAAEAATLLRPVLEGASDVAIAAFPRVGGKSGFGLAQGLARWGVRRLTGRTVEFPLSGQRVLSRRALESLGGLAAGYGIETAMTVDLLRAGFRLVEVPTTMAHRRTRRDLAGFRHRGRQLLSIARVLLHRALMGRRGGP